MTVLVTEAGFAADEWTAEGGQLLGLEALESGVDLPNEPFAVDFPNDRDPAELEKWFDRLAMVRVQFPAFSDGRGFSIARKLRSLGYAGRLRAAGPLIADQFRAARRVGFDEVELPDSVAARQPEAQWRVDMSLSYQRRLIG